MIMGKMRNLYRHLGSLAGSFSLIFAASLGLYSQTVSRDYKDGALYIMVKPNCGNYLRGMSNSRSFSEVYLKEEEQVKRFREVLFRYGFREADNYFARLDSEAFRNVFEISFSKVNEVEDFIGSLEACECVHYAEKVPLWYPTFTPNDPRFFGQWTMGITQAEAAWALHRGAKNEIVIAVVDDAIRIEHEDLRQNLWVNPGEIPDNGIDDDGNGYIDDIHGADVANNTGNPNPPAANLFNFGHGTHCAGIATATTNNGLGVSSLGYDSKLMAIKAKNSNNTGGGIDATGPGIVYAIANRAHVLSMSFGGGGGSGTLQNVFNFGRRQGTISMSSAGNDNSNLAFFPAANDNVLAVASTNEFDEKSNFSNFGDWIDISAPGSNILSTLAWGNSSYGNYSGTSMACPNVAGLAGYLYSFHRNATADDVLHCLLSGADDISGQNPGFIGQLGVGRINALRSISCMINTPPKIRLDGPRVHYRQVPALFKDLSFNGQYSRWEIEGQIIVADSLEWTFTELGSFPLKLEISSEVSKQTNIQILPVLPVPYTRDTPGYQGDFEVSDLWHFGIDNIQGSILEHGSSNIQGKRGANSGSKAIVLAPDAPLYEPNTRVALYTPMFDFTKDGLYEITFFATFDMGSGLDGFHVEYTNDGGKTWRKLGNVSNASWYNYTNTSLPQSAYLLGESYFSGRQLTYRQFRYNVTQEVVGKLAAFRFVMNSQETRPQVGFAIDDFEVIQYDGELQTKIQNFTGGFNRDRRVVLQWSTLPEFHCKGFQVEMSTNGRDYVVEGFVPATGYSVVSQNYGFTTANVRNRDLYLYRLLVINESDDGSYQNNFYTVPIAIGRNSQQAQLFDYSPNPFGNFVGFTFTGNLSSELTVRLFAVNGQLIREFRFPSGQAYYEISASDLIPGVYIAYLEYGDSASQRSTVKLVKL